MNCSVSARIRWAASSVAAAGLVTDSDISTPQSTGWTALRVHVLPRTVPDDRVPVAAQPRRVDHVAGAFGTPPGPVLPPGALGTGGRGAPLLGGLRVVVGDEVPALGSGRVDDAGDVPAGRQHEPGLPGDVLDRGVRRRPRHDVVVDCGHDVEVLVYVLEVEALPGEFHLAAGQLVLHVARP